MSKSNAFENDLLRLIFHGAAIDNLANNASASPLASLFVSLHTADVGEAGNQSTNEANYTSYNRVAVARTTDGWTVTDNQVVNAAAIAFPTATGGTSTATHFAVGTAASGTEKVLYKGALAAPLAISNGIQPRFEPANLTITED